MIKSLQIKDDQFNINDLIERGYDVVVSYEYEPNSYFGHIRKDDMAIPFFGIDDNGRILEIGLVGHNWECLIGELFDEYRFSYSCSEKDAIEFQKAYEKYLNEYLNEHKAEFSLNVVKSLIETKTICAVIETLVSNDMTQNLDDAKKSLKHLLEIKKAVLSIDKPVVILDKLTEYISDLRQKIKQMSGASSYGADFNDMYRIANHIVNSYGEDPISEDDLMTACLGMARQQKKIFIEKATNFFKEEANSYNIDNEFVDKFKKRMEERL